MTITREELEAGLIDFSDIDDPGVAQDAAGPPRRDPARGLHEAAGALCAALGARAARAPQPAARDHRRQARDHADTALRLPDISAATPAGGCASRPARPGGRRARPARPDRPRGAAAAGHSPAPEPLRRLVQERSSQGIAMVITMEDCAPAPSTSRTSTFRVAAMPPCIRATSCPTGCRGGLSARARQASGAAQPDRAIMAGAIDRRDALRLARYFGTSADLWINLQADYDQERRRAGARRADRPRGDSPRRLTSRRFFVDEPPS